MAAPTSGQTTGQFIGISNLHVAAMLTDVAGGAATYDTPLDMGKVLIQVQIQPSNNTAQLYADNQSIDSANSLAEVQLTFETAALPLEYQAYLLGHTVTNGVMTVGKDDNAPFVAVMFQSDKRNGKRRFVKFYKVQFQEPDETENTKGENIEYNTPTMTATAIYRLSDGKLKDVADEEAPDFSADTATSWYTTV
ncbi:MAG: phage tail protein [Schwartzia sp.]|nr:phage tail protein [Schwartzia sp. (in: firmicutes)]